jgi:aldose 1-epimerase
VNQPLILQNGTDRCDVYPHLGGSIGRWSVGTQDMLRNAAPRTMAAHDMLGMATFPLVPYSNRIGNGRFAWAGKPIAITPNFAPERHAIHGIGWQRLWTVIAQTGSDVTLSLVHKGDTTWPWAFEAEQTIMLGNRLLRLILRTTNRADQPVPLGFGHHPYFDQQGATLAFMADAVWMSGPDALPTVRVAPAGPFDFSAGAMVAGRDIDHCYAGITGSATIGWLDRPFQLKIETSPQLPSAVVYIPEGGGAFCFEPVPHINNALNLPGEEPAMPVVSPGETTETILTLRALPQ